MAFANTIIFLPAIVILGAVTSYEDLRRGKIRNKWVCLALFYAGVVYALSWVVYLFFESTSRDNLLAPAATGLVRDFDKWALSLAAGMISAFLLWRYKIWGAGDAKLFISYCALIPQAQYSKASEGYYFNFIFLLVCIFIPAAVFLFAKAAVHYLKKALHSGFDYKIPPTAICRQALVKILRRETLKNIFNFLVLFLLIRVIDLELRKSLNTAVSWSNFLIIAFVVFSRRLRVYLRAKEKLLMAIFVLLSIFICFRYSSSLFEFISGMQILLLKLLAMMACILLVKKLIDLYIRDNAAEKNAFAHWIFIGALLAWFI